MTDQDPLSHFDSQGHATMVDVTDKATTHRTAVASGRVRMARETLQRIQDGEIGKGDVLGVARLAGIMAAKRTHDLIPLCHPLPLTSVKLDLSCDVEQQSVMITATTRVSGQTGVEMEALTAVSVAALTVYDMCKAMDRAMVIEDVHVTHKSGGKSGSYEVDR